ncbi:hypothetical protein [Haloplanus halobius]|uniref:hypothetical protein n=1 Tax=Haloplanus halobius TaxID=2934938 RepID=UPI00200D6F7A|nr:hypothetical protein [Haloplanus sp. XH21]
MGSITTGPLAFDSPLDTVDTCITAGGAVGLLTYVAGLALGNVEAATTGVAVGIVCVVCVLTFRSVRTATGV